MTKKPKAKRARKVNCGNCKAEIDGAEWCVRRRPFMGTDRWIVFRLSHCEQCAGELASVHNRLDPHNVYESRSEVRR